MVALETPLAAGIRAPPPAAPSEGSQAPCSLERQGAPVLAGAVTPSPPRDSQAPGRQHPAPRRAEPFSCSARPARWAGCRREPHAVPPCRWPGGQVVCPPLRLCPMLTPSEARELGPEEQISRAVALSLQGGFYPQEPASCLPLAPFPNSSGFSWLCAPTLQPPPSASFSELYSTRPLLPPPNHPGRPHPCCSEQESPPPPRSWRPDFLLGAEHVASADRNLRYRENCASVPVLPWVAPRPSGKGGGLCRHMGGVRRGGASWKAEQGVLGRGHFRMSPTGGWGAGRTHCPVIWL